MNVRFTLEALDHIAGIRLYIERRNVPAAAHIQRCIFLEIDRLSKFPRMGRPGTVSGTYERVVRGLPYVIVYELKGDVKSVVVLALFHGAQMR